MNKEQLECEQKLDIYKGLTWIFGMIIAGAILVKVWNSYELAPVPEEPMKVLKYCVNEAIDMSIEHRHWCGKIGDRNISCIEGTYDNIYVPGCIAEYEQAIKAYNSYHWWAQIRGKE